MQSSVLEMLKLLLIDAGFVALFVGGLMLLARFNRPAFAVMRRNFVGYFSNPTGYVFLCLFVLLTSFAAFWPHEFFNSNLANLDQLNRYLPFVMLVFIPAITMSVWAEERRQGTDELLLTLPAADFDIVIGKYLAAAAIFTTSLIFSQVSNYAVLVSLTEGELDTGLLCCTYLGYWLVGLAMIAIGMVASFLTNNLTVGFILGAAFNAPMAFAVFADVIVASNAVARSVSQWSLSEQFDDFGRGVISLSSLTYFVMLVVLGLYLSMVLIGSRHWRGGRDGHSLLGHYLVRALSLVVLAMGLNVLFNNHDTWVDATESRASSLSADTRKIISALEPKHKIKIEAFISAQIPEDYVRVKVELTTLLKSFQAMAPDKIDVRILENLEPFSEEAVQAEKRYGIRPQSVRTRARGVFRDEPLILGAAFTCGLEKVVVPFFDYGIPVEYELVRSINTVAQAKRKQIGIVRTDAQVLGGFTFAGGQPQNIPKSAFVEELEKQYEVVEVDPTNAIDTEKYDVVLVIQPSSLGPAELENVVQMVKKGQPTAIFEDPLPIIEEMQAVPGTSQPKRQNPMAQMFGGGPPPPKGDISRLWDALGIDAEGEKASPAGFSPMASSFNAAIVWQRFNPYKKVQVTGFTNEFVFIRPEVPGADQPFNPTDEVTASIEELLFPMSGGIRPRRDSDLKFTPLVKTGTSAGTINFEKWREAQGDPITLQIEEGKPQNTRYVLAARISGKDLDSAKASEKKDKGADEKEGDDAKKSDVKPVNVIYVCDIDLIASAFLRLRAQPDQEFRWRFENVTFALNVIDSLSGDDQYVGVRGRKRNYSTLKVIEQLTDNARAEESEQRAKFETETADAIKKAEEENKESIKKFEEAKNALDERRRKGEAIDPREMEAKQSQLIIQVQLNEQRLAATTQKLKRDRNDRITEARRKMDLQILNIQREFKIWAVVVPPIPPLLVGLIVFVRRRLREREGISKSRLR